MAQIGWIRRTTARINIDNVMYTVYEDMDQDGVFTFWTKVGDWVSDLHDSMRSLEVEIRNQAPTKSLHKKHIRIVQS